MSSLETSPPPIIPIKSSARLRKLHEQSVSLKREAEKEKVTHSANDIQIPRNVTRNVLRLRFKGGKYELVKKDRQKKFFKIITDAVSFPITISDKTASAASSAAAEESDVESLELTLESTTSAASLTNITVSAKDATVILQSPLKPESNTDDLDARIGALGITAKISTLKSEDKTSFSKLVLIAGFDPEVALRIVCDGAHDYGSLIVGGYKSFIYEIRKKLTGVADLPFLRQMDNLLTPPNGSGGGNNARVEVITKTLDDMQRLGGVGDLLNLDDCLVGSGIRNGPADQNCESVFKLAFSFGMIAPIPDSIMYDPTVYYINAARELSFRALWGQSLPQFIDAAGTPSESSVTIKGAKFLDLTPATLLAEYGANVSPYREFEGNNNDAFIVHNYYENSTHVFRRNVAFSPAIRGELGGAERGTSVEILNGATSIGKVYAKQSISLNGLSNYATGVSGRGITKGGAAKTKDPIYVEINTAVRGASSDAFPKEFDKQQVMIVKQILDWAQAYLIAFLWHNFSLVFALITNDTFLLRIAKWLRLPFVILMTKHGMQLYCFDNRAMLLSDEDKKDIKQKIMEYEQVDLDTIFTDAIRTIFEQNNANSYRHVLMALVYKRALEIKKKLLETSERIIALKTTLASKEISDKDAQVYRYLLKQPAKAYLIGKFKDDIETQFSSANCVNNQINAIISNYTKIDETVTTIVTLEDTLLALIDVMKAFEPTISPDQMGLWLTKLPLAKYGQNRTDMQREMRNALGRLTTPTPSEGNSAASSSPEAPIREPVSSDIAKSYNKYCIIDWFTVSNGAPVYPFYYTLNLSSAYPMKKLEGQRQTSAQREISKTSEFTPSNIPDLPELVEPKRYNAVIRNASDNFTQLMVKYVAPATMQAVPQSSSNSASSSGGVTGGARKGRRVTYQRGGALNLSFQSVTVNDKMNLAVLYDLNDVDILDSTTHPAEGISKVAAYFYALEAYLWDCSVHVGNSDTQQSDYVNMLYYLSDLRVQCFRGTITEEGLVIEIANIFLTEMDEFPSVMPTILFNNGFDKKIIFDGLHAVLGDIITATPDLAFLNEMIEDAVASSRQEVSEEFNWKGMHTIANKVFGYNGDPVIIRTLIKYESGQEFVAEHAVTASNATTSSGNSVASVALKNSVASATSAVSGLYAGLSPPVYGSAPPAATKPEKVKLSPDQIQLQTLLEQQGGKLEHIKYLNSNEGARTGERGKETPVTIAERELNEISASIEALREKIRSAPKTVSAASVVKAPPGSRHGRKSTTPAGGGGGGGSGYGGSGYSGDGTYGGYRRTLSRLGKKNKTRKAKTTASHRSRRTRRRK